MICIHRCCESYHNTLSFAKGDPTRGVLGVDNITYDAALQVFRTDDGRTATKRELGEIADRARKAFDSRRARDDDDPRAGAFGRATIARAILASSFLRGTGQERAALVDGLKKQQGGFKGVVGECPAVD